MNKEVISAETKAMMSGQSRLAWRLDEIARETGLSIQFLRKEVRFGRLKARRIGRCVVILNPELQSYLKG